MPFASNNRCTQKPSSPASWITTIFTGCPATCCIRVRVRSSRPSNAPPSPPAVECFDILSLPGAREVTSHVARLSSSDAYSEIPEATPIVLTANERHPTAPCCASSCYGQPGRPYQGSHLSLSVWMRHGSVQPLIPPGRLFDERSAALLSTEVQGI